MRKRLLSGVALLGFAAAVPAGTAQAQESNLRWFGTVYMKFLDGNRNLQGGLASADTNPAREGGDQGQGTEVDLSLRSQVSRQVEVGARIQSRFSKNYWANGGGFGSDVSVDGNGQIVRGDEANPLSAQYVKLRGAFIRLTPGYDWLDSAFLGTNDMGQWDPFTVGKIRYIDRDNLAAVMLAGSAVEGQVKWDVARISLPRLWAGPGFGSGELFANDAAYVGQVKYAPSSTSNFTVIATQTFDGEVEADNDIRNGVDTRNRYSNTVGGLKGQYSGLPGVDMSFAAYYSNTDIKEDVCGTEWGGGCSFSPTLRKDADDFSVVANMEVASLFGSDFSLAVQAFHIGAEYNSLMAARRESDVLLTEGREGFWANHRPLYNAGSSPNGEVIYSIGYGGWNGHMDQVVSLATDNDLTDFDERAAESVLGWQGVTLVPRYSAGDLELQGEASFITFDTNWQACGGENFGTDCAIFARNDNLRSWGVGGDFRSPYAPFQDKTLWIFALNGNYLLDVGNGVQLGGRVKYVKDKDNRVTGARFLEQAYNTIAFNGGNDTDAFGNTPAGFIAVNPDWAALPEAQRAVTSTSDDNRKADYWTVGGSAGYQLTDDFFARLVYEWQYVDLFDGTTNVRNPGLGFEGSNTFGYAEYMTGEHSANKFAVQASYFLSGFELGADVQYIDGKYSPEFRAGTGQTLQRAANGDIITPFGNISPNDVNFEVYRMKVFAKVQF